MIEQLWYGWAARGVEGLNMQQIIAASPGLTSRSTLLTQIALTQCTPASEPTFGWYAHNDIHIVFRRSPAGLDGRGRPGNYFVHVLAADKAELPACALAAIVTSGLLLGALPDELPSKLPHVTLDDLPAPDEDEPALLGVLAGYLANLRDGRLTALATDPDRAAGLAGLIAATMPAHLGLTGFSAREKQNRAAHYDLVSGPPPNPLFGQVDPADQLDQLDTDSARLLIAAGRDRAASECVELLAAGQSSRRDFALAVADWCAIERADPGSITSKTLQLLIDRPGIRRRFTSLPALPRIVELAFAGDGRAGQTADAFHLDGQSRILDLVCDHVRATPEGAATLHALVRAGARNLAIAAVGTLAQGGEHLDLASLGEIQQLSMLDLFPPDPEASPTVKALLQDSGLGTAVVGRARYPLAWQVLAARRHAARTTPEQFTALLQQEPDCVTNLLTQHPEAAVIQRIGEALARIEVGSARQILRASAGLVAPPTEQTWWDTLCGRLDPPTLFALIAERARRLKDVDDRSAADAFVKAANYARVKRLPPPSFIELGQIFRTAPATEEAWRAVTTAFVELGEDGFRSQRMLRTLDAIQQVSQRSDRQNLIDLFLCRILAANDRSAFDHGIAEVERHYGCPATAALLLRAATSLPAPTATSAERLLNWGVRNISRANSPESVADALDSHRVRTVLAEARYAIPRALRDRCTNKLARRWLAQVTTEHRGGWPWSRQAQGGWSDIEHLT
jgi:hypothetical protein